MIIPAGTYKGVDKDTITQASPTFLMVNKNLDAGIVYKLLKHLYEHPKEKNVIHPIAKEYNMKTVFAGYAGKEDLFMPFHEGAIEYLKEKGFWPPK